MDGYSTQVADGPDERLMREAVEVAEQLRLHLSNRAPVPADADAFSVLSETAEVGRITSRVGFCVAWLLARRAVRAGELSPEEALEERWRLGGGEEMEAEALDPEAAVLSPTVARLSARSGEIYARVQRLDAALEG